MGVIRTVRAAGLRVTGIIASSTDDWDVYESLHWRALEEWLQQNPDDPDATTIAARHRAGQHDYLAQERGRLGWVMLVGWKGGAVTPSDPASASDSSGDCSQGTE
jgi:hypothetical protein